MSLTADGEILYTQAIFCALLTLFAALKFTIHVLRKEDFRKAFGQLAP